MIRICTKNVINKLIKIMIDDKGSVLFGVLVWYEPLQEPLQVRF